MVSAGIVLKTVSTFYQLWKYRFENIFLKSKLKKQFGKSDER